MGVIIATNIAALNAQRSLRATSEAIGETLQRLASGDRITRASTDPAGLAVVTELQKQIIVAGQAIRNVNDGISALYISDSSLEAINHILTRIVELAEQSANGTYTNRQRSVMELEVKALGSEIERIAVTTNFNSIKLLSGAQALTLQVGFDSLSTSRIVVGGVQGTLESLRLASSGQSQFIYTCLGPTEAEAQYNSRTLLAAAMNAIDTVNQTRGSIGANEGRLHSAVNVLESQRDILASAKSQINDADVAEEATKLTRLQIAQQAGLAVLSHANLQPQRALQLLPK